MTFRYNPRHFSELLRILHSLDFPRENCIRSLFNFLQTMPLSFWIEIRCHYLSVVNLIRKVDKHIKEIIVITCTNNFFLICEKIHDTLRFVIEFKSHSINVNTNFLLITHRKRPYLLNQIAFWYTFLFLIGRTIGVLYLTSNIHVESRETIKLFRRIPSKTWSLEVLSVSEFTNYYIFPKYPLSSISFQADSEIFEVGEISWRGFIGQPLFQIDATYDNRGMYG